VRWLIRFFVLSLLVIPIGIIVVTFMCIETTPLVEREVLLSTASVERAKILLHEHDPRKLRSGEVKTVSMSEEELSLVANHLINRFGSGGAALEMKRDWITLVATLDLSKVWPGHYLNIETHFSGDGNVARFEKLKFGPVSFPPMLVRSLAGFAVEHIYRASGVRNAKEVLRAVAIQPSRLDVTYQWQEEIVAAVRDRLVSRTDRVLLRVYNDFLAAEIEGQGTGLSFTSLVEATFRKAGERSPSTDPVAENRAAITVLAAYVNGSSLTTLVPEAEGWVKPTRVRLKIHARRDFVQHFTASAALAVAGGGAISNAIGLYKEVDDAAAGSGFSFRDLAADMAGTQFGQTAVESESSASRLQNRIALGIDDIALMPNVSDLKESMSDAEFKRRYGGVGGDVYERVVQDIEQRIANSGLYRP